ncbi:MAG: SigB/SigF/SigG family RNA polymerase sigma factor [Clostridia bacterium]|nr:SigB/SigF/SigG family RNA polymerase sigma factor [Clostridia bacterium]
MKIIGLIWSIVKRFSGRGYELDDLYQIGCIGFIKSIQRFDTNFEVKLSTYSVPYMIGEIKRFLRDDGTIKVSRSLKELNARIRETQKHFLTTKGKELTIEELAKELKVTKEDIALAIESANPVESIEKSVYNSKEDKEIGLVERISTNKDEAEMLTNKMVVKELLDELQTRDKKIIMLRFFKEKTQSEVAKILGINQVQVSRIERRVLASMKIKLMGAS